MALRCIVGTKEVGGSAGILCKFRDNKCAAGWIAGWSTHQMRLRPHSFFDYLLHDFFEFLVVKAISILTDGDFFEDHIIDVEDLS